MPDLVEVWGGVRSLDQAALEAQNDLIEECFQKSARELGGKVESEFTHSYSGFSLAPESEVVKRGMEAMARIGVDGQIASTGGGSDANVFNAIGIPAINIGIGCQGSHSTKEQIAFADLCNLASLGLAVARGPIFDK